MTVGRRVLAALAVVGVALWLWKSGGFVGRAEAQVLPVVGIQQIGSGLGSITSITNARDARLFLTIQTGQIRIYSAGSFLGTPFLDISSLVSCCTERGLL